MPVNFSNLSIQRKLTLLIIGVSGTALLMFTVLSVATQVRLIHRTMVDNLTIISEAIADLSTAALSFEVQASANEILKTLHADPDIEVAVIYDTTDNPFAVYLNPTNTVQVEVPDKVQLEGASFIFQNGKYKIQIFKPILVNNQRIGTFYILSNLNRTAQHLHNSAWILLLNMAIVFLITVLCSARLQRLITQPVSFLARTARNISESGDYGIRVEKTTNDEIGDLIDDFNVMLQVVQERDAELNKHRNNLELMVKDRTEELRAKRDEALAAARAKSEFLANMSHEIRTPMNGVIGVLSLLRDASLTDEYRRLLDTAIRSADSLLLIINDILDFSKIEAGKIDFESIDFDLRELMEEAAELFIDTANLKQIDLTCFVPTDLCCKVNGDPNRLRQIITNLLSNALKFTESGEVMLRVSQVRKKNNRQVLKFVVEDTGIGIEPEAMNKLFEKFTQADGSTTRKYGGTGLGLSVCKQLVEMQGGKIGVTSGSKQGALFWFTLPVTVVEETCPLVPCWKLKNKRVLVVDDVDTNREIIEHYLSLCAVTLYSCSSGTDALQMLADLDRQGEKVDIALLDYQMVEMDGITLADMIHQKFGPDAPELVMMSSGLVPKGQAARARLRAVLLKPIRQFELYDILTSFSSRDRLGKREQEAQQSAVQLRGTVLLVDDEPINQKIAVAILEKFGLNVDVANNGREAVTMTAEKHYGLVLMDIQMPEMSGYEATEQIRRREKELQAERVVIVAMTANAMETTRRRCLAIGMDDFITKPIKPDILAERLRPWLRGAVAAPPVLLPEESETESETKGASLVWDRDRALEFVGGDQGLLLELIELFLQRNGQLLGQIETAIKEGDAEALRDAAHAYKGAVNHFAADEVRQLAVQLEQLGKYNQLENVKKIYGQLRRGADILTRDLRTMMAAKT